MFVCIIYICSITFLNSDKSTKQYIKLWFIAFADSHAVNTPTWVNSGFQFDAMNEE